MTATPSGGGYSVGPDAALKDGQYTAIAQQDNILWDHGVSAKSTFTLSNAAAAVTLNSLGTKPLLTATPTFSGVAVANKQVTIAVYPGSGTNSTPVQFAVGTSGSDGHFSLNFASPLADGQYTAVAADATGGLSRPLPYRIKVHPPALTLTEPASGGHLGEFAPSELRRRGGDRSG